MSLPAAPHHDDRETRMITREVIDVDHDVVNRVEIPCQVGTKIKYGPPSRKPKAPADVNVKVQYILELTHSKCHLKEHNHISAKMSQTTNQSCR